MSPRHCRVRTRLVVCATLAMAAGCGVGDDGDGSAGAVLTVLAASSLTDVFTDLEPVYERRYDGVDVRLIFGASSTLAEQVVAGAPGDVLATADLDTMQRVVDAGLADDPVQFARNHLVLVTPSDNPADVHDIDDLQAGTVTFAVCVPEAPCGAASREVLRLAGVRAEPVTEEPAVRDVLTKVLVGEVDAGLVYASDARSAGDRVRTIDVPEAARALTDDVIAVLGDAAAPGPAGDWVALVTSAQGRQALRAAGFLAAG